MEDFTSVDILKRMNQDYEETVGKINVKKFMVEGDDDYDESSPTYNFARWATEDEFKLSLRRIELMGDCKYDKSGIPLISDAKTAYVDATDSHTLIIGASGSKKTRLFIMPSIRTLSEAGESMVITDPKAELYDRTAQYLEDKGYNIVAINFRDSDYGDNWNPLTLPYEFFLRKEFDTAIGLLHDFAHIAVPNNSHFSDPYWDDSARSTFLGLLLILFASSKNNEEINIKSLLDLRHSSFGKDWLVRKFFDIVGTQNMAYTYLSGILIAPEKTLGSILSVLDSHLSKFIIRPKLTEMICRNNLNFYDIGEKKTAVFVIMPDEKTTYHGLVGIFVKQCYEALIFHAQRTENHALRKRVNFILDEFSSLPQMKDFPAMIAAARSRNIRFNIVVQSEKQLKMRYSDEADTIKGNCNNWVFLTSKELSLLNEISALCDRKKNGNQLITVSRLQRLSKEYGEVLVIRERMFPFVTHMADINAYDHEVYVSRKTSQRDVKAINVFDFKYFMETTYHKDIIRMFTETLVDTKKEEIEETNTGITNSVMERVWLQSLQYYKELDKVFSGIELYQNFQLHRLLYVSENNKKEETLKSVLNRYYKSGKNVCIIVDSTHTGSAISYAVFNDLILNSVQIPLHLDCSIINSDYNDILKDKDFTLITYLIVKKLQVKEDDAFCVDLENEFQRIPDNGQKEYVLILENVDMATNILNAVYNINCFTSFPNLQIIVTGCNKKIIQTDVSRPTVDEQEMLFRKVTLYFDEKTNDVRIKTGKPIEDFIFLQTPENTH